MRWGFLQYQWLTAFLVSITCAYYAHRATVPPKSAQPYTLQILLGFTYLIDDMLHILDDFGVVDYIHAKRTQQNYTSYFLKSDLEGVTREDTYISGVPVRVYTPSYATGKGMVYIHGGGWTLGSVESHDPVTMLFAKENSMVVIAVAYRLSPEYSQLEGLADCVAVTKHLIQNANEYGVDPLRVVVAGDSAGGTYATSVAMVLRDEKFNPAPALQLLIYPVTQGLDLQLPSYQQNQHGPFLTQRGMAWFFSMTTARDASHVAHIVNNTHVDGDVRAILGMSSLSHERVQERNKYEPYVMPKYASGKSEIWDEVKEHFLNPYNFPLMADDLTNLPDAYVMTAQFDPLRDDGTIYVKRLREAGVEVTHYNSRIGWHAMIRFCFWLTDSMDVMKKMSQFIEKNV